MSGLLICGLMLMAYNNRFNYLDITMISFNLFLFIPAVLSDNQALFISIYILPISGYYMFRTQIGNKINIFQLIIITTILISSLTITEYVNENYFSSRWFDYENANPELIQKGSIYGGNRSDQKYNPVLKFIFSESSKLERPLGVAMNPQGTGALLAAFALFLISLKSNKYNFYYL